MFGNESGVAFSNQYNGLAHNKKEGGIKSLKKCGGAIHYRGSAAFRKRSRNKIAQQAPGMYRMTKSESKKTTLPISGAIPKTNSAAIASSNFVGLAHQHIPSFSDPIYPFRIFRILAEENTCESCC